MKATNISSQFNHISILNELQQATHNHHNCFKHGRENHLVLQLLQVYSSPSHSVPTSLIVVLLLPRITLLILHSVNFSGNRLHLIGQIVYISYLLVLLRVPTGRHKLCSRSSVDRLQFIADLIAEGNTNFIRLGGGKAHR